MTNLVPSVNQTDHLIPNIPKAQENKIVSLNDILQKVLIKYQPEIKKGNIIIRSEHLPSVEGDAHLLKKLFDNIFTLIVKVPSVQVKQFLHIDFEEVKTEEIDLSLKEGFRRYAIEFNTNIKLDLENKEVNNEKIDECNVILKQLNGDMKLHCTISDGCLFSIVLPGKLN
jgi:hypothetical protein